MSYFRPPGLLAGFHTEQLDGDVPELVHAGEQWAPRSFPIRTHSHMQWEMYLQSDGETSWSAEGRRYQVPAGALFAAPPGLEHGLEGVAQPKHHFYFVALDVDVVLRRLGIEPWSRREVIIVRDASVLAVPFRQLIREVSLPMPYRAAGIRTALDALVLETSRLLMEPDAATELAPPFVHAGVARARELLDRHPGEPWKVSDLARMVGVSANYLAERFTRDIGMSPHQYLLQRRIDLARDLLATSDVSITEIAHEMGFSSGQYFATTFRRITGMTPNAYRRGAK